MVLTKKKKKSHDKIQFMIKNLQIEHFGSDYIFSCLVRTTFKIKFRKKYGTISWHNIKIQNNIMVINCIEFDWLILILIII